MGEVRRGREERTGGGGHTDSSLGGAAGRVSMGLMQATPGEMKSFRPSALRMALMAGVRVKSEERVGARVGGRNH